MAMDKVICDIILCNGSLTAILSECWARNDMIYLYLGCYTGFYPKHVHLNAFYQECHDDIKWKHFLHCWSFARGIHRSPVDSPHKGQWCEALMFYFICTWTNNWANNQDACDLRCHWAHYDVTVMYIATYSHTHTSIYNNLYPIKYAHSLVVFCCVVVMVLLLMDLCDMCTHILQGCFTGTVEVLILEMKKLTLWQISVFSYCIS